MRKAEAVGNTFPNWILEKWQGIINVLAETLGVSAVLITQLENEYLNVLVSCHSDSNPYSSGMKVKWQGRYCEDVVNTKKELLVSNALKDRNWDSNPDLEHGMIAYFGLPLNFPDGQLFGTFCVFNSRERAFTLTEEKLMLQFKNVIEEDLTLLQLSDLKPNDLVKMVEAERLQLANEKILLQRAIGNADVFVEFKSQFLQNISYEIKTPLNSILGFSKMLNKPQLTDEKRKSFTSIIINSSNLLQTKLENILTIAMLDAKQEKVTIQPTCINSIILDLLSVYKTQAASKKLALYVEKPLSDNQSEIFTDKSKVIQILNNLISNSLKFTHEGYVEFGYTLKDNELEFYVKDTGVGINSEMQGKIFERFLSIETGVPNQYSGTGFGLSISKGLVEFLGGRFWLQSEPGKGSIFFFTLPYKHVREIEKANVFTKPNLRVKTVLVAEDEEFNFQYLQELLMEMDFNIIHAKDGKIAVEICKSNSNIDLILMDLKMPIMDGNEAALLIKEFRPELPIIAQSAYTLNQYLGLYSNNPFDDFLLKPINDGEFKQKLIKYLDS